MPARTVGRIQSGAAFAELQRSRARATCGSVRATFVPVDESVTGLYPQVGYAIGRNCGNAVVRNSLRRRMRVAVRVAAPDLPRGAYLLRVDRAAAASQPAQFRASVSEALRRASRSARTAP